jgi:hypothetical protein
MKQIEEYVYRSLRDEPEKWRLHNGILESPGREFGLRDKDADTRRLSGDPIRFVYVTLFDAGHGTRDLIDASPEVSVFAKVLFDRLLSEEETESYKSDERILEDLIRKDQKE